MLLECAGLGLRNGDTPQGSWAVMGRWVVKAARGRRLGTGPWGRGELLVQEGDSLGVCRRISDESVTYQDLEI